MNLAQEAYEAYANHTGWKSLTTGSPLAQWDALPEKNKVAWMVSAAWIVGKLTGYHDWKIKKTAAVLADENRMLREALVSLIGCDTRESLEVLERDFIAENVVEKAVAARVSILGGIQALLHTLPNSPVCE